MSTAEIAGAIETKPRTNFVSRISGGIQSGVSSGIENVKRQQARAKERKAEYAFVKAARDAYHDTSFALRGAVSVDAIAKIDEAWKKYREAFVEYEHGLLHKDGIAEANKAWDAEKRRAVLISPGINVDHVRTAGIATVATGAVATSAHLLGPTILAGIPAGIATGIGTHFVIGSVDKDIGAKMAKKEALARATGQSPAEFRKEHAELLVEWTKSRRNKAIQRWLVSIGVSFGTAGVTGVLTNGHGHSAGQFLVQAARDGVHHIGLDQGTADYLAYGTGFGQKLAHTVGALIGAGWQGSQGFWHGLNEMFGTTAASAQDVNGPWRPGPHPGWPVQNGGHPPMPQRAPMPRINGGPTLQGVLINEFGQVVRQLEEGGHAHGGGYGGHGGYQEGGYQGEGRFGPNGDRMVGQHWEMVNGRRVLVTTWTHAEHHETYQHREVVQHHDSVRHADCPPDQIKETPELVQVDHIEKILHKLGTHPFASSRAEAFDAAHIDKLVEQYRGAGKSPEFLAALKQWMITEGKLKTWNETTLDHNAKFALMANVFDKQGHLVHGVQLDTKETYIAEEGKPFTYTDTSGKHEITMVRPDKVGNNVGCNNFAIEKDEIIHTQTIHGCVADAAGGATRSIAESNGSLLNVQQQINAIPGGEQAVERVLRELGPNTSIHDLCSSAYINAHLSNVPDADRDILHKIQTLFHDNSHAFARSAEEYNSKSILDELRDRGFMAPEPASR